MRNLYLSDEEFSKRVSDGEKQYYIEHPERKQQHSERMKKYWSDCDIDQSQRMIDYFTTHPDTANKHATGMIEYYKDVEHINETSRKSKEYYKSEKAKQKSRDCMVGRMKKVIQIDLNGNEIKIWNCVADAAKTLNIFSTGIFACLSGKQKQSGGYKWKYYDHTPIKKSRNRIILQLDKEGNVVHEYESVTATIKEFHISKRCIMKSLKHERDFSRGYKWVYKDEYEQQVKTV